MSKIDFVDLASKKKLTTKDTLMALQSISASLEDTARVNKGIVGDLATQAEVLKSCVVKIDDHIHEDDVRVGKSRTALRIILWVLGAFQSLVVTAGLLFYADYAEFKKVSRAEAKQQAAHIAVYPFK